jgi:hypothetical protein
MESAVLWIGVLIAVAALIYSSAGRVPTFPDDETFLHDSMYEEQRNDPSDLE